jgi:hypothetical protein
MAEMPGEKPGKHTERPSVDGMSPDHAIQQEFATDPTAQEWPFDQPPNCVAISLRSIVFDGGPILYVTHDEDDHGWQFLDGAEHETADAAVVALSTIVKLDPSVMAIADLPPGWRAWRESVEADWERGPNLRVSS